MMKRLFWFVLGAFAGVFGVRYAKNKAREAAEQLTPGQIAADVLEGAVKLAQQGMEIVRNLRKDEEVIHFESESVPITQNQN
jgi:hypothetical protein